ncbi:transcriptional regulator [Akkermansiaceae bacterium]|nr:transcriptional regulator [Akkermansiaceae bacterium]
MKSTTPMKLVTVVTEGLLKEKVIAILRRHSCTGFTVTRTDGEGSRGVRASDWEGPNLKIESIVSVETGEAIVEELSEKYFENYSLIAWITDVRVLRGEKFATKPKEG